MLPAWRRYLRFWRPDVEADVDDELRFHVESRIAEYEARGMTAGEARARALERFGDVSRVRTECRTLVHREERRMARARFIEEFRQDVRYGVRTLRRSIGFTATAAMTLGLGIGATASIFAAVNGVFLRSLPVRDPERLVAVGGIQGGTFVFSALSWLNFQDLRAYPELFEDVIAHGIATVSARATGEPERRFYAVVSDNFFSMLGVGAQIGRVFTSEEARRADPLVVLTHGAWQARFGGDSSVVGRVVHLNGLPFTVVGVAPRGFTGVESLLIPDGFLPALTLRALAPNEGAQFERRDWTNVKVKARLPAGVSLEEARVRADVVSRQLEARYPKVNEGLRLVVYPERWARPDVAVAHLIPSVTSVFMALAGAVLLIACANIGNLLLARGTGRRSEFALRSALGASGGRVLRQLLTESVLLAVLAQAVGAAVAAGVTAWLGSIRLGIDAPIHFELYPDARVWAFTFVAAVAAGLLTGLAPALGAARVNAQDALKEGGGRGTEGRERARLRNTLAVVQVAVSLVLLVCAGLFVRGLRSALRADLGFVPSGQLIASVDVSLLRYDPERTDRFNRLLLERAGTLPGVTNAALAVTVPLGYSSTTTDLYPDDPGIARDGRLDIFTNRVSPGYFAAMGMRLLDGRDFTVRDDTASPRVAVVNRALAEQLWPGRSAIGRRIRLGVERREHEVIGVAQNSKYVFMTDERRPYVYVPILQQQSVPVTLHVRAAGDPAALAPAVRRLVASIDPELVVYDVRTMEAHIRDGLSVLFVRLAATLAGAIALLGLVQTAVGLYGVVAYTVAQRSREIGIRIALGAAASQVVRGVIAQGLRLTAIGLGIGLAAALVVTRGVSALLYGVRPTDATTFAAAALLLTACAFLASWLPARRSAKADPMVVLRAE